MYWSSTEHWLNEQSIHWVSEFMATDVRMPGIGLIVSLFLINDSGTQQTNFESRIRCTWYRFVVGTEQRIVLFCSAQAGNVYCLNAKLVSHSSRCLPTIFPLFLFKMSNNGGEALLCIGLQLTDHCWMSSVRKLANFFHSPKSNYI